MEKKKANFTEEERTVLLELVDKHKVIIENKKLTLSVREGSEWLG